MSTQKERVITEEGRLCFDRYLFEANEDGKFSAAIVIDGDKDVSAIKKLMMDTARATYGDKIPAKFTWGMKSDKDADIDMYPFLEGNMLVQGGTKFPIPVSDVAGNEIDRSGIKGGDTVRFSVSAYCYEFKGKKGVSLNVNAVLLVSRCAEEDAFYKKPTASSIFGDVFKSYESVSVDNFYKQEDSQDAAQSEDYSGMDF